MTAAYLFLIFFFGLSGILSTTFGIVLAIHKNFILGLPLVVLGLLLIFGAFYTLEMAYKT